MKLPTNAFGVVPLNARSTVFTAVLTLTPIILVPDGVDDNELRGDARKSQSWTLNVWKAAGVYVCYCNMNYMMSPLCCYNHVYDFIILSLNSYLELRRLYKESMRQG